MIVNNYSEFKVNSFSNNRDIRMHVENSKSKKGHNFVQKNGGFRSTPDDDDDAADDDAWAMTLPRRFRRKHPSYPNDKDRQNH